MQEKAFSEMEKAFSFLVVSRRLSSCNRLKYGSKTSPTGLPVV
jgi:hypothetical protein